MSDLDDDLLALAGVSDSEEEEIEHTKKRKAKDVDYDEEEEDEDEDEEEEELINPYPLENKYKDDADRDRLLNLDEMEREEILFERSQEVEKFNEKKFLQDRLKQQRQQQQLLQQQKTRTSKRSKPTGNDRTNKLSELRKQREQKKRKDDYSDEEDEDDEMLDDAMDEDEEELGLSDYEEGDVVWGTKTKKTRSYARGKLEDVNKIMVGRSFLHKYYFYGNFEELIIGCYGRINLGMDPRTRQPNYRMVKIDDVQHLPEKKYKLPNYESDLYLNVSQNKRQTKLFPINIFSDNAITEQEFSRYVKELEKTQEEIDYVDDINDKAQELNDTANKALTDQDINEMMNRKQQLLKTLNGFDAVFQKANLMDKLKIARQQKNQAEIRYLQDQLNKLEQMLIDSSSKHNNSEQLDTMSRVNERNRKLNLQNIRKAEIKSNIQKKTSTKEDGDPFKRLKTNTRLFYQDIINLENEKAQTDAKLNYNQLINEKTIIELKIANSSYRELGVMDKLIHEIDIDIDISL